MPPPLRRARARRRAGLTFLELLVVMTVLTVAVSMFTSMVVATSRQRGINRENSVASNAARIVVEEMRNTPFAEIWARYNPDPDDDPDGPGTAPGNRFAVEGLQPLEDAPDGLCGEVHLPTRFVDPLGLGPGTWELREDLVDEALGLPRDLSGDGIVDVADHADDYLILPVRVEIAWQGRHGPRRLDVYTQLTAFKHD